MGKAEDLIRYRANLQGEIDSAALYHILAEIKAQPQPASDASVLALQEGLKPAREEKAQVRLVHVIDVMPHGGAVADAERLRQASHEEGTAIYNAAIELARQAGVGAKTVLLEADWRHFSAAIVEEALRWSAELIVLVTHGRTGLWCSAAWPKGWPTSLLCPSSSFAATGK